MSYYYVDSSVVIAIMFEEKGAGKYRNLLEKSDGSYSSYLLEAEVYATASREKIPLEIADAFIETISLVLPGRILRPEYHKIFATDYCRGADACHVATALYLDPKLKKLQFLTADMNQYKVAKKLGFNVSSVAKPN